MISKVMEMVFAKLPVGPRQVQQVQSWIPSLAVFGASGAAAGLYFTDWKLFTQFIPFYSGKYVVEDEE